jgi:hypothetical protein
MLARLMGVVAWCSAWMVMEGVAVRVKSWGLMVRVMGAGAEPEKMGLGRKVAVRV